MSFILSGRKSKSDFYTEEDLLLNLLQMKDHILNNKILNLQILICIFSPFVTYERAEFQSSSFIFHIIITMLITAEVL